MRKLSKGFTLLELLIVISIIGILIAVGTASYTSAQKKARDSRRKSDLRNIQNAAEQFFSDRNRYPASGFLPGGCVGEITSSTTYLPAGYPKDPKTGVNYTYACDATGSRYQVVAGMENSTAGNASDANDPCSDYGTCTTDCDTYCVKNLQ